MTDRVAAFRPAWWLPGAHLQTIVPSLWPVGAPRGRVEFRTAEVGAGNAVRLEIDRPAGTAGATLLLVHGMGGSARSGYMLRTARLAVARGWNAVRMNLRNCGGTEALSRTLYNAGQSEDIERVLAHLRAAGFALPFATVGFSLGGNIVLRHAGQQGSACGLAAIAAVNPPVELERCVRAIERPQNRVYQLHYTVRLCRQHRRIRAIRGASGPQATLRRVRGVRGFDTLYTAPDAGFPSAEAYYEASSAAPLLRRIARPTLVLAARDDPFVPAEMFSPLAGLPAVRLLQPRSGGHCGYWQSRRPRFWAAESLVDFVDRALARSR